MEDDCLPTSETPLRRAPWNKGKLIGAKPPLRPSHVWSIRTKLQMEGRKRDLALFNLAIDSKLRGCDVVVIRVDDVAPNGYALDRATVRQKQDGKAGAIRVDRPDAAGDRRVLEVDRPKARSILVRRRAIAHADLTTRQYARLCRILGGQHRT